MAAGQMEPRLLLTLTESRVPDAFTAWMTASGVLTLTDFVLGARGAKEFVDPELIDKCGLNLSIAQKIAVRKAWAAAQESEVRSNADREAARVAPDNAPISQQDTRNLHELFYARRQFKLPTSRLLHDDLMGRLLADWKCQPKRMRMLMPEHMRGQNASPQSVGTNFSVVNGSVTAEAILAGEEYSDSVELYLKVRMYANTISFITVTQPEWFPYMAGEVWADQLLDWMKTKYNGRRYPLQFSCRLSSPRCRVLLRVFVPTT